MTDQVVEHKQTELGHSRPITVDHAFILDIDGVLTNTDNKVPDEVITKLYQAIEIGHLVSFNTGRDMAWVKEEILSRLLPRLAPNQRENIVAVAEKGSYLLTFQNGQEVEEVVRDVKPPAPLIQRIQDYVDRNRAAGILPAFFDERKKGMVTIQADETVEARAAFTRIQSMVANDLNLIISDYFSEEPNQLANWKIDPTATAIDFEHVSLGKALGAQRILDIWQGRGIEIAETHTVGDSRSDFDMYEPCAKSPHIHRTTFHYVGSRNGAAQILNGGPSARTDTRYVDRGFHGALSIMKEAYEATHTLQNAAFNGGAFVIQYLAEPGRSFEIAGSPSKRRAADGSKILLSDLGREEFRASLAREKLFWDREMAHALEVRRAYYEARSVDPRSETTAALRAKYIEVRSNYLSLKGGKVGISNIECDGTTLRCTAKLVWVPTYKQHNHPAARPELTELGRLSGTALILLTADNRMIVQTRSPNNKAYGGVLGASVAGLFDAPVTSYSIKNQMPAPVTTKTVLQNSFKETREEIGIDSKNINSIKIIGFATDRVQLHDEFLLMARSNLTIDEIKANAERSKNRSEWDFYEDFISLEASPEAIETLLTQVRCPIPPSHAAAFVAAGFNMVAERDGIEAAREWKLKIRDRIAQNYSLINSIVKAHYQKHPNKLLEPHTGKPPRNANGYSPHYLPTEQGLPHMLDALREANLI